MDSILLINLIMVAVLIALTALFVGSEFSIIKVRMSRIEQLVSEGNGTAVRTKKIIENLDYYLSACQLGITVTALGLGWLGEPTVERILHPVFENFGIGDPTASILSFAIAFSIVTFLHVVIGELAPKTLAIQYAERMALFFTYPLVFFGKIFAPFIWLMNGSARLLLRMFGVELQAGEQAHSEEELKIIMTESFRSGEINQTELSYMQNIFSFDERTAKDVMVPRTQMKTVSLEMTHDDLLDMIEEQHTRFPVTENGDKDEILGFVNVKEMLTRYTTERDLRNSLSVHELPFLHETASLQNALLTLQKASVPMAIVVDEYGGTEGLITVEDILEEIVGEIRDEFDTDEEDEISSIDERNYRLSGRVLLDELEVRFGLAFDESEDIDTIGGWIQTKNIEISEGDSVDIADHSFTVLEMENHQIITVQMTKHVQAEEQETD